ncbi:MAG: SDR family NAD(P)-dependent oxidoreductase [Candidatus Acidiferrum sp.]
MASVLIRGSSKGIDLDALAFGRAGHQVHSGMRNPRSPELARRVAEEKLPITVTTMDVDSDESARDNIAVIQKQHGAIDVLVAVSSLSRGSP